MEVAGDGPPDPLGTFTVTTPPSFEATAPETTVTLRALSMFSAHLTDILDARFVNLDKRIEHIMQEIGDVRDRAHQSGIEFEAYKTNIEQQASAVFTRQQDWSTQVEAVIASHDAKSEELKAALQNADSQLQNSYATANKIIQEVTIGQSAVEALGIELRAQRTTNAQVIEELGGHRDQLIGLIQMANAQNATF